MKRTLCALLLAPLIALAGFRVDTPALPSTAAANGTNSLVSYSLPNPLGAELREVQLYAFSANATVTVTRVSYDLATTSTVFAVTNSAAVTVTLNTVETSRLFRLGDYFTAIAGQTGVTFRVRPVFLAYEP